MEINYNQDIKSWSKVHKQEDKLGFKLDMINKVCYGYYNDESLGILFQNIPNENFTSCINIWWYNYLLYWLETN